MYRAAPNHALYQGDVFVAPMPTLKDRNPLLVSEATEAELQVCRRCGERYGEQAAPRQPRTCAACQAVERIAREKRYTPIASRLRSHETLFDGHAEKTLTAVEVVPAMVLSHSCDIDNANYLRLAPMRSMDRFADGQADEIRRRIGNLSYFYLPETADTEEGFVDLDHQFNLPVTQVGEQRTFRSAMKARREPALAPYVEAIDSRLLSLDAIGLRLLYSAIITHLTRPGRSTIEANPSDDALTDDPDRPQRRDLPAQGWWWPHAGWPRRAQRLLAI